MINVFVSWGFSMEMFLNDDLMELGWEKWILKIMMEEIGLLEF